MELVVSSVCSLDQYFVHGTFHERMCRRINVFFQGPITPLSRDNKPRCMYILTTMAGKWDHHQAERCMLFALLCLFHSLLLERTTTAAGQQILDAALVNVVWCACTHRLPAVYP